MRPLYVQETVVIFSLLFNLANGAFWCRRDNPTCSNHGTCLDTGVCTCTADFDKYDCLVPKKPPATCIVKCNNGGSCYHDPTDTSVCHCPYTHYGKNCDSLRVPVKPTCGGTSMDVVLKPYTSGGQRAADFAGGIYVEKSRTAKKNCPVALDATTKTYKVTMSYGKDATNDCGTLVEAGKPAAGQTTYTNTIVIEYQKLFWTHRDEKLVVKCILSTSGTWTGTVTKLATDNTVLQQKTIQDTKTAPIALQLTDGKVALDPAKTKKVGEQCDLKIVLSDTTVYKKIKVQTCTAASGDKKSQIDLVKDGCRLSSAAAFLSALKAGAAPEISVTLPMKVFKFVNKNDLLFTCTVLLCTDGQTSCAPSTCDSKAGKVGVGLGRKKRAAEPVAQRIIEKKVSVHSDEDEVVKKEDSCPLSTDILVILIVLGSVVLLLSVLSVILSFCIIKLKSKKFVDTHSVLSSTTSLRM